MPSLRDAVGRFVRRPLEDLSPSYRRRIERAEARGKSRNAARGHSMEPIRASDSRQRFGSEAYEKSLRVLGRMRDGESLSGAARAEEIRPETVKRNVGSALETEGRRLRPKAVDSLYRRMELLTDSGPISVEPATSREASRLARYHNAVRRYLELGDEHQIGKFAGKELRVRGGSKLPFLTDLNAIDRLASAGVLSFTSIYRYVA